jgi:hypothetical protein
MNRPRAPLIIHHQGFLPYLPFCLMQNIRSQPGREIILLGDAKNRIPGLQYRHVDSGQFHSLNEQLIRRYRHATDADFHDERRCLERWFILAAFFRPNFRRNTKHLLQYLFFGEICRRKLRSQSSGSGLP